MMHSRQRDYTRQLEELEDKLSRVQDENDEMKRKGDKLDRTSYE